MKIHILQPTGYNPDCTLFQTKTRWVIGMTLPYLAALVPDQHEVKDTDECLQDIDFSEEYDLVTITTFSHASKRACEIARTYCEKGTKVVMGGGVLLRVVFVKSLNYCRVINSFRDIFSAYCITNDSYNFLKSRLIGT